MRELDPIRAAERALETNVFFVAKDRTVRQSPNTPPDIRLAAEKVVRARESGAARIIVDVHKTHWWSDINVLSFHGA